MWKLQFPDKLVALPRRAAELRPRGRRALLPPRARGRCRDELDGARRAAATTPRRSARSIARLQREPRGSSREAYDAAARARPGRCPTSELYLVLRAGLVLPVEEFIGAALGDYLAAVRGDAGAQADGPGARRCSPARSASSRRSGLIKTLERSGCYIVDDDFVQVHRWIKGDIAAEGDPLDDLVRRVPRSTSIDSPTRYIGDDGEGARAGRARARASGAEGVLFCAPSFCDPALLDQPMADARRGARRHPLDRVQVRREQRPVPGHPRAGRHLRRLDQAVERGVTHADAETGAPPARRTRASVRQKQMIARALRADWRARARPARRTSTRSFRAT